MTIAPAASPRGRPRDPSVDRAIADTALRLLADHGFDGFTMEAIAAGAGISKATLYRRFASREDVLRAALTMLNDDLPDLVDILEREGLRAALVRIVDELRVRTPDSLAGRLWLRLMTERHRHAELELLIDERLLRPRRARLGQFIDAAVRMGALPESTRPESLTPLIIGPGVYLGLQGARAAQVESGDVVDALLAGLSPARRS